MRYDICDYGAVPDGVTPSTGAIQAAIDACVRDGGGTVVVPKGKFATDMITLGDNVELHLEHGSVLSSLLQPVPDPLAKCPEPSQNTHRYLVGGVGLHNVSITGSGTIHGNPDQYFWNKNDGLEHPLYGQRYWPRLHRPKGMVHFRECTDVVISGVELVDPPCYVIWMLGCDNCLVDNVRINADLRGPNDDGIDLDCCSNVRVANCSIVCGDDGIAIKSDIHELGYDKACENITVTGCVIKTTSDGIRLGFEGDGAIRRIIVSNCVIYDTMVGISIMVPISPRDGRGIDIYKGPVITDCLFNNLAIDAFQTFNFQMPKCPPDCPEKIQGYIDRVCFSSINATATRGSYLGGDAETPIRHVEFSQMRMTLHGEMGEDFLERVPNPYPLWSDLPYSGIPWPFYVRNAKDVVIRDSVFSWENATGAWQSEIAKCENASVRLENVRREHGPCSELNQ